MDPNALAGMIFTLLLALLVGGFILLYPLARRAGALLEARLHEKKAPPAPHDEDIERLREGLAQLGTDVQRLIDRQDFMEKLLSQRMDPRPLATPRTEPRPLAAPVTDANPPGSPVEPEPR